tara:strand:+ start:3224 stop:3514 length:291 start_codon:yes stop_codon:yes gene_type:complete
MKKDLTISPLRNYNNCFGIYTCNPWFKNKEEVVFSHDQYGVSFRVVGIDDVETLSVYSNDNGCYRLNLQYVDLHQYGRLVFDYEDSTEDQIYFDYL